MVVESHEGRDSTPLARGVHLVGVLGHRLARGVVELHDAVIGAVAGALVEHGALEHRVDELSVRADREPLKPPVGRLAFGVAGVVGEVRYAGGAVAWDQVVGGGEGAREGAVPVELVEGRAVLVRDEEFPIGGIDHEAFGIESAPEDIGRGGSQPVEVEGAGGVRELDGLDDVEVRDGTRARIDVDGELLHPRVVGKGAPACPAIAEPPPLAAIGIVVEVGEHSQALVEGDGIAGQIERVGWHDDAVHEGRAGEGRGTPAEDQRDDGSKGSKCHEDLL